MSLTKSSVYPKTTSDNSGCSASARPDRRIVWEWNLPLLAVSIAVVGIISVLLVSLYLYQSRRIFEGVLLRASAAEQAGDTQEQVRWLARYVALSPKDVDAHIKLALSVDSLVTTPADLDPARRRLNAALIACGENPAYVQQKQLLRSKLVQRLLQFGPLWAAEVQRQVLALNAPPGDPEATKWLAQSLVLQQGNLSYHKPAVSQLDRQQDPWGWLIEQPLGEVLRIALEAKPDDVDLAASFLGAAVKNRDWFATADKPADDGRIDELAKQLVGRLRQQTDDGRAQLIAYAHLQATNSAEAGSVIEQAVEPALRRLSDHMEASKRATASNEEAAGLYEKHLAASPSAPFASLAGESPTLLSTAYESYWDWQLATEAARRFGPDSAATDRDLPRAKEIYDRLLACDSEATSLAIREANYVAYGSLLATTDGLPTAIEIWTAGAERLPKSLELTRMLASAYTSQQDLVQARTYVDQYQAIVESQRDNLDGIFGAKLTTIAKQSIRQRLDAAGWEVLLLQASLALAETDLVTASKLSAQAFASPLVLNNMQRLQAGRLLADCYARRELWDLAGQTLERCIVLAPLDAALRRSAAMAWRSAGIPARSSQQLEKLDDGSFSAALEIARLTDMAESVKSPEHADWSAVTQATQLARSRYDQASAEERKSMKIWQLDLLELKFKGRELAPTQAAQLRLDHLEQIALSNPHVSEVQILAAASLAASGRQVASQQAVDRLQELANASGQSQDQANLVLIQASLVASHDGMPAAVQALRAAMRELPDQRLLLAKTGADAALRARQPQLAYELLREVPDNQLDTQALFTLCSVAQALPASAPAQTSNLAAELADWTARLRSIEGEEGTHWRYLKAQELLSLSLSKSTTRRDQLDQASRLYNEIDARRPHWGRAAALGGQIASQKGYSDEAIKLLRRAIHDGDRQITTIWTLVQLLKAAGRIDEASQELEHMGGNADAFLPMSAMLVDLAQLQGDFDGAVTKARELTREQSQEYSSWLLLADALLKSVDRRGITPEDKQAKLDEGRQALDKAHKLSDGKDIHVWDARFRFQLALGDRQAAEQELIELQKSSLDHEARLLAAGRGYLQLNKLSEARKLLDACLAINSQSSATHLALADLHNRTGDPASSLDSLRQAQNASPKNPQLRERLAVTLAFGDLGKAASVGDHVAEIDALLANASAESSPRTRLIKALISLSKGDSQQQQQSLLTLRDVARSGGVEGADAKRILAYHFANSYLAKPKDSNSLEGRRNFDEAVAFFAGLTAASPPNAIDVARYADFMLKAFGVERDAGRQEAAQSRLADTQRAVQQLQGISGSSVASLQLSLRLALAQGRGDQIASLTSQWVQGAGEPAALEQQQAWQLAGRTLAELGLTDEAIDWLERVYQQDPSEYQLLVVALAQNKQIDRALQLSLTGYQNTFTTEAATLLAEVAMLLGQQPAPAGVEQALHDALAKFSDSPQFLEAFATVRLMQERYEEAATWFGEVEKLAPGRVRTLNNWAMALSELPMGKDLALQKIQKAVEVYGRFPELLDTLGLVLFRNGRLDEARQAFSDAAAQGHDPRFQLHLAQVALALGDVAAAHIAWQSIDKAKLNELTLTSTEQAVRTQLENANQQESL